MRCSNVDTLLGCTQGLAVLFSVLEYIQHWGPGRGMVCRANDFRNVANAAGLVGEERFSAHAPPLPILFGESDLCMQQATDSQHLCSTPLLVCFQVLLTRTQWSSSKTEASG